MNSLGMDIFPIVLNRLWSLESVNIYPSSNFLTISPVSMNVVGLSNEQLNVILFEQVKKNAQLSSILFRDVPNQCQ